MFLPNGVAFLSEARISTKRIQDFMLLTELGKNKESAPLAGVTTYTFSPPEPEYYAFFFITILLIHRMESQFKVSLPILKLLKYLRIHISGVKCPHCDSVKKFVTHFVTTEI